MLKKIIGKKKILMLGLGIIVGILISVVGVYAATLIESKNVTYDNSKSKLESTNVQDALDELYDRVNMPLSSYVISLYAKSGNKTSATIGTSILGTETVMQAIDTNLLQDSHGNIRYYGANPDNYVTFNEEEDKWRIIGVFDNKIKIVRDIESTQVWDTNNSSNWSTASIQIYLNNTYYNSLKDVAKKMIDKSIWNLGGAYYSYESYTYDKLYSNNWYNKERGIEVYPGSPTTWTGNIGLIYPSDHGYASDLSKCNRPMYEYNNDNNCVNSNWLFHTGSAMYTITPVSVGGRAIYAITGGGHVVFGDANYAAVAICPTLYLKSDVVITGGNGSSDNPYVLKI